MSSSDPVTPAWDDALLKHPHDAPDKRRRVQQMFAAIAPSYDLNNRLHSFFQDQPWRKKAVTLSALDRSDVVVDVACGTGDLALKYAMKLRELNAPETFRKGQVIGVDFTHEMLPIARNKSSAYPWPQIQLPTLSNPVLINPARLSSAIIYINGDAQCLPLEDRSADVVSIAFGIRNVQDPLLALREFHRILRPGGRVIILEFSLPANRILRAIYNFYFRQILPRTATLISRDKTGAYKYLPESVNTFITRETMMQMMRDAGFERVEQFPMSFGVCVCYRGFKPVENSTTANDRVSSATA